MVSWPPADQRCPHGECRDCTSRAEEFWAGDLRPPVGFEPRNRRRRTGHADDGPPAPRRKRPDRPDVHNAVRLHLPGRGGLAVQRQCAEYRRRGHRDHPRTPRDRPGAGSTATGDTVAGSRRFGAGGRVSHRPRRVGFAVRADSPLRRWGRLLLPADRRGANGVPAGSRWRISGTTRAPAGRHRLHLPGARGVPHEPVGSRPCGSVRHSRSVATGVVHDRVAPAGTAHIAHHPAVPGPRLTRADSCAPAHRTARASSPRRCSRARRRSSTHPGRPRTRRAPW